MGEESHSGDDIMIENYLGAARLYRQAAAIYIDACNKLEELFTRTQPGAIRYDSDKVVTPYPDGSVVDEYIAEKERQHVDDRIRQARQLLDYRKYLLDLEEQELRKSREPIDIIFYMRFLDRKKIRWICWKTNYSESTVKRKIREIRQILKDDTF